MWHSFSTRFHVFFGLLLLLFSGSVRAQVGEQGAVAILRDSIEFTPNRIRIDFLTGKIDEKEFLQRADSAAKTYLNDEHLPALLATYKDVAWSKDAYRANRIKYFHNLGRINMNNRDYGSALFYFRKSLEISIPAQEWSYVLKSNLAISTITQNVGNYAQAVKDYETIEPFLSYVTGNLPLLNPSTEEQAIMTILLYNGQDAYIHLNDTASAGQCYAFQRQIAAYVHQHESDSNPIHLRFIDFKFQLAGFLNYNMQHKTDSALACLHAALNRMAAGNTPNEMDSRLQVYSMLISFHLEHKNLDSASRYFKLFEQTKQFYPGRLKTDDQEQRLYYYNFYATINELKGNPDTALRYFKKAQSVQDSIYQALMVDYYNSLYAKTQAAYNKEQLIRTEIARSKSERFNLILKVCIFLLLIGSALLFYLNKQKQKERFMQSKLDLARNIHDEIAPMLLYARMLMKAEARKGNVNTNPELEQQISQTLEAIRKLSHELKQQEAFTVDNLSKFLQEQLKKNERFTGTGYTLDISDTGTSLSAYQYDHLEKCCSELIANTIKHADCTLITIGIRKEQNRLIIDYSDNGKGFDEQKGQGIGLKNIEERLKQLKGSLMVENNFPNGYKIQITVPLF